MKHDPLKSGNYHMLKEKGVRSPDIQEHIRTSSGYYSSKMRESRMFNIVTRTWNPVTGCTHQCIYCWARMFVERRLRYRSPKYKEGFIPKLHQEEFKKRFKPGEFIFVCDMGDLFCRGICDEWILKVLKHIARFPHTTFLLLTKNPQRYTGFIDLIPNNVVLGCTIETNRDDIYKAHSISRAPLPSERYLIMKDIMWNQKFVSIEPVILFDTDKFFKIIVDINPKIVYIGYDNYGVLRRRRVPEPPIKQVLELVELLQETGIEVKLKGKTLEKYMSQFTRNDNKRTSTVIEYLLQTIKNYK